MWFVVLNDLADSTIVYVQTRDAGIAQEWLTELSSDLLNGDSLRISLDLSYNGDEGVMDDREARS